MDLLCSRSFFLAIAAAPDPGNAAAFFAFALAYALALEDAGVVEAAAVIVASDLDTVGFGAVVEPIAAVVVATVGAATGVVLPWGLVERALAVASAASVMAAWAANRSAGEIECVPSGNGM